MNKLKVSVLIANYNNQLHINECIDSIKKQTYQNIEIIFHDDFSTDNSIKCINQYSNIKIIKNKKRGKYGSFNQMNAYKHNGFWQPMDTLRDKNYLEELWASNNVPWKTW